MMLRISWFFLPVFCVIVSIPLLQAGFYDDDSINSTIRGMLQLASLGIWEFTTKETFAWFFGTARPFLIAFFTSYPFFYIFHTLHSFLIAHTIVVWLGFVSAAWLVKSISKSTSCALLFLFLLPSLWTIRDYHDPLTSFGVLLPMLLIFMSLCVSFFIQYQERKSVVFLLGSLFFYVCSLLTYEVGITVFFVIFLLAWINRESNRHFIIQMVPYVLISLFFAGLSLALRYLHPGEFLYSGIQFGTVDKFWNGFSSQLTAPLPLFYWVLRAFRSPDLLMAFINLKNFGSFLSGFQLVLVAILGSGFLLGTGGIIAYLLYQVTLIKKQRWYFLSIGICFVLIPAILMGLSQRYQTELRIGYGYLPIYIQYAGVVFIFLALFSPAKKIWRCCTIGFIASLLICIALVLNMYSVRQKNEVFRMPRILLEQALQHGLLAQVPESSVLIGNIPGWYTPAFYMQNARVKVDVMNISEPVLRTPPARFFIAYEHITRSSDGFVLLGTFKRTPLTQNQASNIIVENPKVFFLFNRETNKAEIIKMLKSRLVLPLDKEIHIEEKNTNWAIINLPLGQYTFRQQCPLFYRIDAKCQ